MTTTAIKLITATEFAQMPEPSDGSKEELVQGVIVTIPAPGFRHGVCQTNVAFFLKSHTRATALWARHRRERSADRARS